MKKTLTVLASAVLALSMLFVMGCKHDTLNAEDAESWYHQLRGDKNLTIELTADSGEIDWWAITDMQNAIILNSNSEKKINHNDTENINLAGNAKLDKNGKQAVVLWIHQPSAKDKKGNSLAEKTLRGKLTLRDKQGIKINAKDYRDAVQPMGLLEIHNDETNGHKWHGNYHITEAVPLVKDSQKDEYALVGGLKVTKEIKPNEKFTFVWPAGENKLALRQPDRFDPSKASANAEKERAAAQTQANWYWTLDVNVIKWGVKQTVKSSECGNAIDVGGGALLEPGDGRNAISPITYYTESDFITPEDVIEMR